MFVLLQGYLNFALLHSPDPCPFAGLPHLCPFAGLPTFVLLQGYLTDVLLQGNLTFVLLWGYLTDILLQGYLTCLPRKDALIALDLQFVVQLTESLSQCPNMLPGKVVPELGDMACVWDSEKQIHPKAVDYDQHRVSCAISVVLLTVSDIVLLTVSSMNCAISVVLLTISGDCQCSGEQVQSCSSLYIYIHKRIKTHTFIYTYIQVSSWVL